jgi:hypothetical protein
MDAYFQVISYGMGAGLGTGAIVFFVNWGVKNVLGLLEFGSR